MVFEGGCSAISLGQDGMSTVVIAQLGCVLVGASHQHYCAAAAMEAAGPRDNKREQGGEVSEVQVRLGLFNTVAFGDGAK